MSVMTREQRFDIIKRANKSWAEGGEKKQLKSKKSSLSPPHLVKFYLEEFGRERLLNAGFNLSEAEEKYGKNWLD